MLTRQQTLLLRADAGPEVGLNHVNRSVCLAKAWQKLGGSAELVCEELPGRLELEISKLRVRRWKFDDQKCDAAKATRVSEIANRVKPDWAVIDAAKLDLPSCKQLKQTMGQKQKLAAIVNSVNCQPAKLDPFDWLITPTTLNEASTFRQLGRCLTGNRFWIPETIENLTDAKANARCPRFARKVLVWLTESAETETLATVLETLKEVAKPGTVIDAVVTENQRDDPVMVNLKKADSKVTFRFIRSIERRLSSTVPVDLAIVDCGIQARRIASRRIPVARVLRWQQSVESERNEHDDVCVIPSVESQQLEFRSELSKLIRDQDLRQSLSDAASSRNDPEAADRIARRMASEGLSLEVAAAGDWDDVWRWTRDPESQALSVAAVDHDSQDQYVRFLESLNDPAEECWMLRRPDGRAVASVLLERQVVDERAVQTKVLVDPSLRNRGYGTAILERTVERIFESGMSQCVVLQTKPGNHAATHMARKAGFVPTLPTVVDGQVACRFSIDCDRQQSSVASRVLKRSA